MPIAQPRSRDRFDRGLVARRLRTHCPVWNGRPINVIRCSSRALALPLLNDREKKSDNVVQSIEHALPGTASERPGKKKNSVPTRAAKSIAALWVFADCKITLDPPQYFEERVQSHRLTQKPRHGAETRLQLPSFHVVHVKLARPARSTTQLLRGCGSDPTSLYSHSPSLSNLYQYIGTWHVGTNAGSPALQSSRAMCRRWLGHHDLFFLRRRYCTCAPLRRPPPTQA
jgi:hypothetical protein